MPPSILSARKLAPPKEFKNSRVALVTGGENSLCINFSKKLAELGYFVFLVGKEINESKNEIGIKRIKTDLSKGVPAQIKSPEVIFHLEPYFSSSLQSPIGTKNLLEKFDARFILGSSIDIYGGAISSVGLENYFGIDPKAILKHLKIEALRFSESLVHDKYKNGGARAVVLRFGFLYGPGIDTQFSNSLGVFINEVVNKRSISIHNKGLDKHYYVYIDDAVDALLKTLNVKESNGKIIPIIPKESVTEIEIAYLIKSLAGEKLEMSFKDEERLFDSNVSPLGLENTIIIDWLCRTSLSEGIEKTLDFYGLKKGIIPDIPKNIKDTLVKEGGFSLIDHEEIESAPPIKDRKKVNRKNFLSFLLAIALFLVVAFLSAVPFAFNLYLGAKNLEKSLINIQEYNFNTALISAKKAERRLFLATKPPFIINLGFKIMKKEESLEEIKSSLRAVFYLSKAEVGLLDSYSGIYPAISNFSPNSPKEKVLPTQINEAQKNIILAVNSFKLAESELKMTKGNYIKDLQKYKGDFSKAINMAKKSLELLENLPELLAYNKTKKYLLLFQNPMELRATGGFIGSYATLIVKDGKIESLEVDDIYNPDGRLDEKEINIKPPEPVRVLLNQENLRIRDANWDPFFPDSAKLILDMFKLVDGRSYDGVVALDIYFLKSLLEITGEIYLPFYNEKITADNLYEKTQFYSETEYFEGSPQKKVFLSNLSGKVMQVLFEKNLLGEKFLSKTFSAFNRKHILTYLPDTNFFSSLFYDGGKIPFGKDYLFVVDSNLGGTKTNYFVDRSIMYKIDNRDRDGSLVSTLTVSYDHNGRSNAWPGGPYVNYLRVYIPKNSEILKAYLIKDGKSADIMKGLVVENLTTLKSVGTSFEIKAQGSLKVEFVYKNITPQFNLDSIADFYTLDVQKQPGTLGDPFSFELALPLSFAPSKIPGGSQLSGNSVKLSTNLTEDLRLDINF